MRTSWKLGRFAGIDVFLHPTFFLILLLPGAIEHLPLVLALFGCVLLHEYGHALTARKFGIGTVDITLYPIGGVARLARMPRAPGVELLIALAGPAVNFVIAGWLFVLLAVGAGFGLSEFLVDLALLNLILGCFNLIPAFPMDGGRVLRALISGWTGRARATSFAASVGRTLAVAFGVYSLLYNFNLIHVALAAFIYFAAGAEEAGVLADERRRAFPNSGDGGVWNAPPGYQWVESGRGVWQLAPKRASAAANSARSGW